MKAIVVEVDRDRCKGHGLCNAAAPEIYELDDEGFCVTGTVELPAEQMVRAKSGASNCPEMAIKVTDLNENHGI